MSAHVSALTDCRTRVQFSLRYLRSVRRVRSDAFFFVPLQYSFRGLMGVFGALMDSVLGVAVGVATVTTVAAAAPVALPLALVGLVTPAVVFGLSKGRGG